MSSPSFRSVKKNVYFNICQNSFIKSSRKCQSDSTVINTQVPRAFLQKLNLKFISRTNQIVSNYGLMFCLFSTTTGRKSNYIAKTMHNNPDLLNWPYCYITLRMVFRLIVILKFIVSIALALLILFEVLDNIQPDILMFV